MIHVVFHKIRAINERSKNQLDKKVSPYIIIVQVIFCLLWIIENMFFPHHFSPVYVENRIPLEPALEGVCSLANYSVAYEETQ